MSRGLAILTPDVRANLTGAYRALRAGSEGLFRHDGALHWGVPASAVRAYVLARYEGRDVGRAVAVAKFGAVELGPGGLATVAAYVGRLKQLERGA